jgi:lipopolysaccharide transport system permease protein
MRLSAINHSAKFLISHRQLLWQVTANELRSRYAGSIFGVGWAALTPLLFLVVYAGVYLVIFKIQVPGLSSVQYVLLIFTGLVPFLMTSEALSNGVGAVVANKSVLSNTVFPIDLAPAKSVLLSQTPMVIGYVVIVLALIITGGISWTIVLLPLVWGFHVMGLIGVSWILSLVNLVFRDLQNMIGILMMVLMIISPIAYTPEMVPPVLKALLFLNPFAYFVTAYQDIVIFGHLPAWWHAVILVGLSVASFIIGGYFFSRAKQVLIDYV